MNEAWKKLTRMLMQDMHLQFHYDTFVYAIEQQVEVWDPCQTAVCDSKEKIAISREFPSTGVK